jgi:hypothetical protein
MWRVLEFFLFLKFFFPSVLFDYMFRSCIYFEVWMVCKENTCAQRVLFITSEMVDYLSYWFHYFQRWMFVLLHCKWEFHFLLFFFFTLKLKILPSGLNNSKCWACFGLPCKCIVVEVMLICPFWNFHLIMNWFCNVNYET